MRKVPSARNMRPILELMLDENLAKTLAEQIVRDYTQNCETGKSLYIRIA